jgi:hypothetical protein
MMTTPQLLGLPPWPPPARPPVPATAAEAEAD